MRNKLLKLGLGLGGVILLLLVISGFSKNDAGFRQHVQTISGNESIRYEPGVYYAGIWSTVTDYPDKITTVFSVEEQENVTSWNPPFIIRFNDATKATAQATIRWSLPLDEEKMILLHKAYRSPEKLAQRTFVPYSRECLKFAAQLMESETHYSGGRSKLKEDFRDQLANGQYVLEYKTEYVKDTVTNENVKLTSSFIRIGEDGQATRIKSDMQIYSISVDFAAIDDVDYEEQVDLKLAKKIEQSTLESVSKQTYITAQQEALTEKARGEQLIAKVKAEQTAIKLEAVIQAEKAKEVSIENLAQAKNDAAAELVKKRAAAEGDRLKVLAGLTPRERAQFDKETAIGVAAAMAGPQGIQFPNTLIIGGGGDSKYGSANPFEAVGLESFMRIADGMSGPKKGGK